MTKYSIKKKNHPDPMYCGIHDLQINEIYHVISGFNHTSFKIVSKVKDDSGMYYNYGVVLIDFQDQD